MFDFLDRIHVEKGKETKGPPAMIHDLAGGSPAPLALTSNFSRLCLPLATYYWKASGTRVESYMILCGTESPLLDLVAWGGLFLCVWPQMLFTWLNFQQVPGLAVSLNIVSIMEFLAAPICLYPSKPFPLPHHTSYLLTTLNISHIAQTIMYLLLQIFSCMKIIADILLSNLRAEPHY